jgi:hypothetical protein
MTTRRWSVPVAAALGLIAAAAVELSAETCTLELKHFDSRSPVDPAAYTAYAYRATYPQHFYVQIGHEQPNDDFSKIVKKEPKYVLEHPFRGVADFGSHKYAFAFDAKPPKVESDDAQEKPNAEKPAPGAPKADEYGRLFFDRNRNGDLTDDGVIESQRTSRSGSASSAYLRCYYPTIRLAVEADGTTMDYAFSCQAYCRASGAYKYASASFNAAAYREGRITLDGKQRRVALVDFNSNGRFDDAFAIREGATYSGGGVVAMNGDMLLVDPPAQPTGYSPYDPTSSEDRHHMSKLVCIDGRFYDVVASAAGDQLTLTPSSTAVGHVTNPNKGFRAVVYGEKGFLKLIGRESEPSTLPVGEWKLLSYTIDQTGYRKEPEPSPEEEKEEQDATASLLQTLAAALVQGSATTARESSRSMPTLVSARGTADFPAVRVREGATVAFPFGPPYKPSVTVEHRSGADQVQLGMSLIGSAGEVCSSLRVEGRTPPKPEFTIRTPDGKVVAEGAFEYG